jgi:hypothetical protein
VCNIFTVDFPERLFEGIPVSVESVDAKMVTRLATVQGPETQKCAQNHVQ